MRAPDVHKAEPIPPAAKAAIEDLLQSADLFRYTAPENAPVALLEAEFAALLGAKFALAVSSCSAALFLSLKALDLPSDAKVLIPAFTFAAVPSAVVHADCIPVLCEVGPNYRIDLKDFESKLDQIDAVIISHMRGHTSDMNGIMALCDARDIPVIEDAAHSLGTTWHGRNIGTIGKIGCFSFQSYKMINAGEGGILISDDADLIARAVIMSGAYEHNWKKHPVLLEAFAKWQNQLPLYNQRMSNLSAAVIRPQLPELARRVADGLSNHDYVAGLIDQSPFIDVPAPLAPERRAPDSIQFNLIGLSDADVATFVDTAKEKGVSVQVFGQSKDNARAFWNWQFLKDIPDLPQTRSMLVRACDVRLPVHLSKDDLDCIATILLDAARAVDRKQFAAE
jgi:dTDP-4-amino-4,6-dideoxygalactose transaminase